MTYTTSVSQTEFGFTGEQYWDSTQLLYLRARHYSPADGRFTSRDMWSGDVNRPLSLNRWMYVEGNPVNLTDPSGYIPAFPNDHRNLTSWLVREMRFNASMIFWFAQLLCSRILARICSFSAILY